MDKKDKIARRHSRLTIIAALYLIAFRENTQHTISSDEVDLDYIVEAVQTDKSDTQMVKEYLKSLLENKKEIDKIISKYSQNRKLNEIDLTALSILQNAINEGFIENYVDPKVAINEAIEIAKGLVSPSQVKFISGLLGNLYDKEKK
jgi:N utilization substance protein B